MLMAIAVERHSLPAMPAAVRVTMMWTMAPRSCSHRCSTPPAWGSPRAATWASFSGQGEESMLVYAPLPPLFLLMASGAYLFVLPWLPRSRRDETSD